MEKEIIVREISAVQHDLDVVRKDFENLSNAVDKLRSRPLDEHDRVLLGAVDGMLERAGIYISLMG
jgi:hypothetical protein